MRLCKGIYLEPVAVAFQDPDEIRGSYLAALDALLDQGAYVGIATHDEQLLAESLRRVGARGLDRERYEFQMLLGVRAARAGRARAGRAPASECTSPFGTHWYEYSIRRLQENPKLAGYAAGDTLRRLRPRRRRRQ